MSTEIKTKAKAVKLTQFSGGKNGLMLSINQPNYFANDFHCKTVIFTILQP